MTTHDINGVHVDADYDIPREEAEAYVAMYDTDPHRKLLRLELKLAPGSGTWDPDGIDCVDVQAVYQKVPFDRIARITGYITGTVDRFNNAKKAELLDREVHAGAGEMHNHWRGRVS